ncbi:MAG TPA: LuxR C-terminal-related transcriptional regulator [Steroidobacteraceae bacterium]|jgi:LuxR family maltose regulon positive regulatory protein
MPAHAALNAYAGNALAGSPALLDVAGILSELSDVEQPDPTDRVGPVTRTIPLTRFRAPRVRGDVLSRPALLQRLNRSIEDNPVTLLSAPGGSGKTTLLAQWIASHAPDLTPLWITIDAEDNDSDRLFASLLQAFQPLGLSWEVEPRALLSNLTGSHTQLRAAIATMVNALCTSTARRIVLILDDLHRIEKPAAFELLDSLIERLPDHVAVVLGSRIEPPLSLARWRAYGELDSFTPTDLQFSAEEAKSLAASRFGETLDESSILGALARTRGWAAGLTLLLRSRAGLAGAGASAASDGAESNRHLFAYLAQEVLEELPADLQDFVLRSSILIELQPRLCEALTQRSDARGVLESLYRRNLFLTAIDELTPVLRFHDMFREFLESELQRRDPALKRELHERVARIETIDSRAIYHLLAAQRWNEAMERIGAAAEERVANGGIATVERWIDAIPEEVRAHNPQLSYWRGTCAWFRWDWPRARRELTPAVEGLLAPSQQSMRVRAFFHLIDSLNSSGAREAAREYVAQASRLPLDLLGKAELSLQQAWCATPTGDMESVALYMRDFVETVAVDPASLCPATADRVHCVLIGIPGVVDSFEGIFNLYQQVRGSAALPWHVSALTIGSWAHLWRGRRAELQATLAQAELLEHRCGGVNLVIERLGQLQAISQLVLGEHEAALATMHTRIEGMQAKALAGHGAVWLRPYRHALARAHWIMGNAQGFREVLPHLTATAMPGEWPFVATASATVRGLNAMFDQDWAAAETALREALQTYSRCRMPMIYADPRVNLAYVLLMQGRKADAWAHFSPVYEEVVREHAMGLLLLESPTVVNALLGIVPASISKATSHSSLLEDWRQWSCPSAVPLAADKQAKLGQLSEREYEVLAEVASGASNKHIARKLSLSLHTVKRHIANILDKLDCDSRGQAADRFRRQ